MRVWISSGNKSRDKQGKSGIERENESGNQGGNEGWSKRAAVP